MPTKGFGSLLLLGGNDASKESSGKNPNWNGVQVWTEQEEDIIVVSAQLTDLGEKFARQAIELTAYMLQNFSVNVAGLCPQGR